MSLPESKIVEFIDEHHVMTLATAVDNCPWCANCFYAYWHEQNVFVFSSDTATLHSQNALVNPQVSASIVLETSVVGKIQGLQIAGILTNADSSNLGDEAKKVYLKRFPFAVLKRADVWILQPSILKLTDNRLGFGKKLIWETK